jgi:hypothetical protein
MNQQGLPPGFWEMFFCILIVGTTIGLVIQIFFLLNLYRTQSQVAPANREIQPGTVWWTILLNFIPIVGNIWLIYMVNKLTNSLRREFEARGWGTEGEGFGRTAGMLWAWGGLVYLAISVIQNIMLFSGQQEASSILSVLVLPIALGLLVCFIVFWVQMYQCGKRLREEGRDYARGSLESDYDDEYRRPRDDEGDIRRRDTDHPRRERDDY